MIACDINETKDYVLKCDRASEPEEQTVFVLRTFNARTKVLIQNAGLGVSDQKGAGEDEVRVDILNGDQNWEIVSRGIVDWSNMRTRNGDVVPIMKTRKKGGEVLTEGAMDRVGRHLLELANAISKYNQMEVEEEGESEGSPSTVPTSEPANATA